MSLVQKKDRLIRVHILDAPLIHHELAFLRDARTGGVAFRKALQHLGRYFAYELTKDFPTLKRPVTTPLGIAEGTFIEGMDRIVIINVLRAAIPFIEGLLGIFFESRIGIISAFRTETPPFHVQIDYVRVPKIDPQDTLIVADPMVATGTTTRGVLREVRRFGNPKKTILACILTTPVALGLLAQEFDDIDLYAAEIDPKLDDKGYIVPGLGDAGDRAFLTL